ncbi:TPA: lipocalin-like domain-containing protein [Klebsiella oxytoca]|nr:lipocalin-like domain-containing protein [Klebsiella oxytoca]
MIETTLFFGTWRLVSAEFKLSDGSKRFPLGKDVVGRLNYDAAGNMSAQLYRADRQNFIHDDQTAAGANEIKDAFISSVCYFGRYTLDVENKTIIHFVEGSLFPNWIGGKQLRYFHFEDEKLFLSTSPFLMNGVMQTGLLVWEKVDNNCKMKNEMNAPYTLSSELHDGVGLGNGQYCTVTLSR